MFLKLTPHFRTSASHQYKAQPPAPNLSFVLCSACEPFKVQTPKPSDHRDLISVSNFFQKKKKKKFNSIELATHLLSFKNWVKNCSLVIVSFRTKAKTGNVRFDSFLIFNLITFLFYFVVVYILVELLYLCSFEIFISFQIYFKSWIFPSKFRIGNLWFDPFLRLLSIQLLIFILVELYLYSSKFLLVFKSNLLQKL